MATMAVALDRNLCFGILQLRRRKTIENFYICVPIATKRLASGTDVDVDDADTCILRRRRRSLGGGTLRVAGREKRKTAHYAGPETALTICSVGKFIS